MGLMTLGTREPVMDGLADPQLPLVQGVLLMQELPVQPPGVYVTVVPQFPLHDEDWPAHGKGFSQRCI